MPCYACNKQCTDEELRHDTKGWSEFKAMCKKCTRSIYEPEVNLPTNFYLGDNHE